jgi:hypothetical protein
LLPISSWAFEGNKPKYRSIKTNYRIDAPKLLIAPISHKVVTQIPEQPQNQNGFWVKNLFTDKWQIKVSDKLAQAIIP